MTNAFTSPPALTPLAVGERDAAKLLGISARTLWNWRRDNRGPRYRREGGRILYSVAALHAWLDAPAQGADHE